MQKISPPCGLRYWWRDEITCTINAANVVAGREGFETILGLIGRVNIALFAIDPEQINATDKLPY